MFHSVYRSGIVLVIVTLVTAFISFVPRQSAKALENSDITGVSNVSISAGCFSVSGNLTVNLTAHLNTRDRIYWGGYTSWDYGAVVLYDAHGTRLGTGWFDAAANGDGGAPFYDATEAAISFWTTGQVVGPFTVKMYDITAQFDPITWLPIDPETGILVDTYGFDPGPIGGQNCGAPDFDLDLVPDNTDNCPFIYNPTQSDVDQDKIGDACDLLQPPQPPVQSVPVVNTDVDHDGVPNNLDNCINEYNPGQEDGWGSIMGDTCDPDWYDRSGVEVQGFRQKNGLFHLHGNCVFFADGASSCPVIAAFDPNSFTPSNTPLEITSAEANGWSIWVYYLHSHNGVDVYQVNTYRSSIPQPDTLVDDKLEIHVSGGTWEWYHRGADGKHGI